MIDTVKIVTMIDKKTYKLISDTSIIKTSYNAGTGEIFYKIVNDRIEGSYSSSLSVRVGEGVKYGFINHYYIEIEGSLHKVLNGYNSHNGYYNLVDVSLKLIRMVENSYNIKLPNIKHWFLQRVDIAICYELGINKNVCRYINNLSLCNFPRRNLKYYQDESIYLTGSTTTLKIYNKLLEFKKHDYKKLAITDFDIDNYLYDIDGFIRFECEIKKKKLQDMYNKKYIRIVNMRYEDLKKVWSEEFMKLLKMYDNDIKKVRNKKDVEHRLYSIYDNRKATALYNFFISLIVDGQREVKKRTPKSTYYYNLKALKDCGIDFTQNVKFVESDVIAFNPFDWKEVV